MHPAMNFGVSVTNCESSMYTAATLRAKHQEKPKDACAGMAHLQPPSFMRSASDRRTGECEYSSI